MGGTVIFYLFGTIFVVGGCVHEWIWWKRRTWVRKTGAIVGFERDEGGHDSAYYPRIECEGPGGKMTFVSKYGSNSAPEIGSAIEVVMSPAGDRAECVSLLNRYLFSIVPLVFGLIFLGLAVFWRQSEVSEPFPAENSPIEDRGEPAP